MDDWSYLLLLYQFHSKFQINSDDVLEWESGDKVEGSGSAEHNTSGSETIEKVLRHRAGYPGATGASTTCYNVEDKGDPNVKLAGTNCETSGIFLVLIENE